MQVRRVAQVDVAEITFAADEVVTAEIRYDDDSPEDGRVVLSTVASEYHVIALDVLEPATVFFSGEINRRE